MDDRLSPEQTDSLPGILEPSENPHLFGHGEVASQLAHAYKSGKMHHALLFAGPQGTGKATLAFHLAWHLLRERNHETAPDKLIKPDMADPVWRQIAGGSHPGILHLTKPWDEKGKKFRQVITVDEVRRAGHFLSRTSHDGGYRIIIVDAADDMNTNAANALLKNLEEPPRATLFILISHSPGRLLPTIRSRCQLHRFQPLSQQVLGEVLSAIGAELPTDGGELERLFHLAEGSARNALLLTQYGGLEIAGASDAVIDASAFDVEAAGKIATAVAARDAAIPFALFNKHLADRLSRDAGDAGRAGDTLRAARLGEMWEETTRTIAETETYNLDKRQHVMGLLYTLNQALSI